MANASEELASILSVVRRFSAGELSAGRLAEPEEIPAQVLGRAAELGLFGLSIPTDHGGLGLGLQETGEIVAELARHDRSFATTIGLHNGLGTRPLVTHGTDGLRGRWLPRLASGRTIAAFAATEAGAGSDLTRMGTVARLDGEDLRIVGEKHYVTNGGFAGLITVLAHAPHLGARARTMVLVPRETPGITVGPEERKLGLKASSTVSIAFDDVRVPADHALGEGAEVAYGALEWGRALMSFGCLGTARAAFDATLAHVNARRQFGRSLARFGAVRAHLAQMARTIFAMESILAVLAPGPDLPRLSAAAKVFCSEGAWDVCDRAVQLHGALGFIEDTGVARLLRDSRVTRIFEGANDVLLVRAGALTYTGGTTPGDARLHDEDGAGWELRRAAFDLELTRTKEEHGAAGLRNQWVLMGVARADLRLLVASACLRRSSEDPLLARESARSLTATALDPLRRFPSQREGDDAIVDALVQSRDDTDRHPFREAFA